MKLKKIMINYFLIYYECINYNINNNLEDHNDQKNSFNILIIMIFKQLIEFF